MPLTTNGKVDRAALPAEMVGSACIPLVAPITSALATLSAPDGHTGTGA